MTGRLSLWGVAALATLLAVQPLVIAQGQGPAKGPGGPGPFTFDTGTGQKIKVTVVADGLVHPFGMLFQRHFRGQRSVAVSLLRDCWYHTPRGNVPIQDLFTRPEKNPLA